MRTILGTLLYFVFYFTVSLVLAQNLVPNPSFETYGFCPTAFSQIWTADPWETANEITSVELHHTCSGDGEGEACQTCVPTNTFGSQTPYEGEGYAGLWAYNFTTGNVPCIMEVLQVELETPMEAGVEYEVSFYVSLGDNSSYAIDRLGVNFSPVEVTIGFDVDLDLPADLESPLGYYLADKNEWMLISGTYIAEGGELYMSIGNLNTCIQTNSIPVNGGIYDASYYYIDQVSVIPPDPEPELEIVGETTICSGDSTTLTALNADSWSWFENGDPETILSTDSVLTISPESTTLYYFSDGEFQYPQVITVLQLPEVDLGNDLTFCQGDELVIQATEADYTYLWNTGDTLSSISLTTPGVYTVEVFDGNCFAADTIEVEMNSPIVFSLGNDTIICDGQEILLQVPPEYLDYDWEWNTLEEESLISVTEEGMYSLFITDSYCQGSDEILVETINCDYSLILPNIFTPNENDINAYFSPIEIKNILSVRTQIYNRWGNLIHESDDREKLWSGETPYGGLAPAGTYYFVVTYTSVQGDVKELTGPITVLY